MQYSTVTNNIIKNAKTASNPNENLYILYERYGSIFDSILEQCSNINLIPSGISEQHRNLFGYDLFWCNNPLNYIEIKESIKLHHLKDLIFFHEYPDSNIKKEDKFILHKSIANSVQICSNDNIQKAWGLNSSYNINYGIPEVNFTESSGCKSVILINHSNNHKLNLLAKHIKQYFPDADILSNERDQNWDSISKKIQQYKIAIVFDNVIDILASLACGCEVISPVAVEEHGVVNTTDFSNIIETIHKLIDNYDRNEMLKSAKNIVYKYNFRDFDDKISSILKQIIREPFLL